MEKTWKAKWICDCDFHQLQPIDVFQKNNPAGHNEALNNHHTLFRKIIRIEEDITSAVIDITADDYYKLYINGDFTAQGPAPSYHFHYNYNRHDITGLIKKGDNIIAVHVYYQGLINRLWNSGDYRQGMIAEIIINDRINACTDSTWRYTKAEEFTGDKIIGYDTQFQENIDERLKKKGWKEFEFNDSDWKNACIKPTHDYQFYLQITPPLSVYKIKPQSIKQLEQGRYLIDFGQEITGRFSMTAEGEAGARIRILCGEELTDEHHVRYQMRCNCEYDDTWILSGSYDILEFFDYKAFRYVEIIGGSTVLNPDSFCAVVRHYPFDDKNCRFKSSDKRLNAVWEICKNAVKYGTQESYLDCPSREKGQYLGDVMITALSHFYLTGDLRIYKKSINDFALSSAVCPGLLAVCPGSFRQEIADYSMIFPYHLLNYYRHSGDIEFLKAIYPVAAGIQNYFKKFRRNDGILVNVKDKWNLVDWPDNLRDHYDFDLSPIPGDGAHNVINAYYYGLIKTMNEIRDCLNIKYHNELPLLKKSFIKTFYNHQTGLFTDSEISSHSALHSNVLPLFFGIAPDDSIKNIIRLVREKRLNCGVYFSYFLLKGLANTGEYGLIYELITCDDLHSWLNMIKEGATTCFEAWGKEQKWNTSLCHPWASVPIPVIIEDILGIRPAVPGWQKASFTPHIPEELDEIELEINTAKSKILLCIKDKKIITTQGLTG